MTFFGGGKRQVRDNDDVSLSSLRGKLDLVRSFEDDNSTNNTTQSQQQKQQQRRRQRSSKRRRRVEVSPPDDKANQYFDPAKWAKQTSVLDLVNAAGEKTPSIDSSLVSKYSDRDLLKLSAKWSQEVLRSAKSRRGSIPIISAEVETLTASLSPKCARLEVAAVSVLASLESTSFDSMFSEAKNEQLEFLIREDDDDLKHECSNLDACSIAIWDELQGFEAQVQ